MHIPLTKPYWGKEEERSIVRALRQSHGAGDGPFVRKLELALRRLTGARYAYTVTSCTHGLELAMRVLGVSAGDEVIIPSFTMTSTANCIVLAGGTPIFADIDPVTYNIDPEDIARRITKRTKGIIVVHYAGMPAPMEKISRIARKHRLFVVEDAAHAINALYKRKHLGRFGDIGVYSFHGTKNLSCGEGGAVITDNPKLASRIDIFRANGTNRKAFLEGIVNKYSWVGAGSSYFLSDLLASIMLSQIGKIGSIGKMRQEIADVYTEALSKFSKVVQLPTLPAHTTPNWHIYAIRFRKRIQRNYFLSEMRKVGIEISYHYVPLHTSEMGKKLAGPGYSLPVTKAVSQTLLRLPIYPGLTKSERLYITTHACRILSTFS